MTLSGVYRLTIGHPSCLKRNPIPYGVRRFTHGGKGQRMLRSERERRERKMRLRSIPILLALAALVPAQFAQGQKANPTDASAMWSAIKTALLSENGDLFFESNLKYSLVPGGTKSVHALMGTVISSRPAQQPDEFVLAMSDKIHPEVTLKLIDKQVIDHYKGPIAPGAKITFRGIAKAFKRDPFMLTVEVGAADGPGPTFAVIAEPYGDMAPARMPSV